MGYYLLEHANKYAPKHADGQYWGYEQRSGPVVAVVVHITAGLEDLDGQDDQSAEKTANYAATTSTKVSWHSGSDSDSAFDLLPASHVAFHCVNYNSRTYGHEISKRITDWRAVSPAFREATLGKASPHLAAKARALGVPLRHATKAEVDRAIATNGAPVGFVGHQQLDPTRRSDPGIVNGVDTFPWARFFELMSPAPPAPQPEVHHHILGGKPVATIDFPVTVDGNGWGSVGPDEGLDIDFAKCLAVTANAPHDPNAGTGDKDYLLSEVNHHEAAGKLRLVLHGPPNATLWPRILVAD